MKTIIVLDSNTSEELINKGFKYIVDSINNKKVYAFLFSEELNKYLLKNYSQNQYIVNSGIRF